MHLIGTCYPIAFKKKKKYRRMQASTVLILNFECFVKFQFSFRAIFRNKIFTCIFFAILNGYLVLYMQLNLI